MFKVDSIMYAKEKNVLGAIGVINYLDETVTLVDDMSVLHVVEMEELVELEAIGMLGDFMVYNHDVLKNTNNGLVYEIEIQEDETVRFHIIDKNYEREANGDLAPFKKEVLSQYEHVLELLGCIYDLKQELPKVDFNIRIIRHFEDGEITYYYVGNNGKEQQTVDLVKALFIGHKLIEEEAYERVTISYEKYLEGIANGLYTEVDPMELANYVAGVTYESSESKEYVALNSEVEHVTTEEIDTLFELAHLVPVMVEDTIDLCNVCQEDEDECDCGLWTR